MKGVNYRETRGMPYVRREYISGKPQIKIARFSSGQAASNYDYKVELLATEKIQIRHNSLEAARLAANKRMATAGEMSFFSILRVYPHVVLRENKMIATAGADRLQEG
ncbi:MAG: 50S ribosomal protein L16, partial [Nitrososphaera sp.]